MTEGIQLISLFLQIWHLYLILQGGILSAGMVSCVDVLAHI